jgi:hypothetical protein
MIPGPDRWGTERRRAQYDGDPARSTCSFWGTTCVMPLQRASTQSQPFRKAFRTRTRIPTVDIVESRTTAPPRQSRSAITMRLPMLPHMRWVCVKNNVKDRNPLRDEGTRWGKPSSGICRHPGAASAAKIDAIFPCNSLRLLLRSHDIAGLSIALSCRGSSEMPTAKVYDGTVGSRLPNS